MSKRSWLLLGVAFFILLLDFCTKWATVHSIPLMNSPIYPYGGVPIFENFYGIEASLVHAVNKGAAWGIFSHYQQPLLIFRICLILATTVYMVFFNQHRSWEFPFALILGGALGNVIDTFLYGHVIDMIHFVFWNYDYPVFNVADAAIFVGICWLFIVSLSEKKKENRLLI